MAKPLILNFLFNNSLYKGKIYLVSLLSVVFITCNFDKESDKEFKQNTLQSLRPVTVASTNFIDKENISNFNTSPQLSWDVVPEAASYMVFLIDLNKESTHWLSYNIVSNSLNDNDESLDTLIKYSLPKPPRGEVLDLSFVVVALDESSISLNADRSNELGNLVVNLMKPNYLEVSSSTIIFQDNSSPAKSVNVIGLGKIDVVIDNTPSSLHSTTITSPDFTNKGNISSFNTSPQLSWDAVPEAASYMVFLIDLNKESIHWLSYNIVSNSLNNNDESLDTLIKYSLPKPPEGEFYNLSFVVVALDESSISLNADRSNELGDLVLNLMKLNYLEVSSSTVLFQDNSSPAKSVNVIGLGKINVVVDENSPSACPNLDKSEGLLISEVNKYWMELVNTNTDPVCLGDYQFRTFSDYQLNLLSFNTNLIVAPQEYIVVRFEGGHYESPQTIFLDKVSLFSSFFKRDGFAELVFENRSSDFIGFCDSSGGTYSPLSGTFIGCVDFITSTISITRDQQLTDSDSANDWRSLAVPTYGGPNDVDDVTDADRDGIPDANERPGTTFVGMPVYDWGARVNQRDIFVHINYMAGFVKKKPGSAPELKPGLDPREDSLNKIKQAFLDNNFHIHFDTGTRHSDGVNPTRFNLSGENHQVPFSTYTEVLGYTPVASKEIPTTTTLPAYKYKYFPNPRLQIFHYVLFANSASRQGEKKPDTKGVAELPGNDVIIFLGETISFFWEATQAKNYIASTLFHELGHNFNLKHGGEDHFPSDKPNYLSSMNYLYVYDGLPMRNNQDENNFFYRYKKKHTSTENQLLLNGPHSDSFIIDYSHGDMEDIDENKVKERDPLPTGGFGDIDWNFDSKISEYTYSNEINGDNQKQVLKDYDEWGNLVLPFDYNYFRYRSLEIPLALGGRELDSHNSLGRAPKKYNFYSQDKPPVTIECEFPSLERFKKTFYSNPDPDKD